MAQPLNNSPPKPGILIAHGSAGGAPDGRTRLAGDDERLPRRRRRGLRLGCDDLHLVTVHELRDERGDLSVDLAAHRHIANARMHRIRKVDGVGAPRQGNQLALRREAKHLIVKQFELGVLEELFRVGAFSEQLDRPAQPCIGLRFAQASPSGSRYRPRRAHARRCHTRRFRAWRAFESATQHAAGWGRSRSCGCER